MADMSDGRKPHVVNLTQGRFSTTGTVTTTAQDVDEIFSTHLPAFRATAGGGRVPVVVWAHGGLVDEASGLAIADRQVQWWLANGVYPIHIAWESGIGDALRQIVASWVGSRGIVEDALDRATEFAARRFGGVRIWSSMKRNAELASAAGGGARHLARRLGEFVAANPDAIELHAVGHSAGAVFHSHFLPLLVGRKVPVASLSLLAPAIRVDEFRRLLLPRIGDGIDAFAMFTMHRELEEDDTCTLGSLTFYHRSLLYLIRAALEDAVDTPILGLAQCVAEDAVLRELFAGRAEAIWSRTDAGAAPDRRSRSTTHGGFDGDAATMDSLARRITGNAAVRGYPADAVHRGPDRLAGPTGPVEVGAVPPGRRSTPSPAAVPDGPRPDPGRPTRVPDATAALLRAVADLIDATTP
jgi:hypothetical protein